MNALKVPAQSQLKAQMSWVKGHDRQAIRDVSCVELICIMLCFQRELPKTYILSQSWLEMFSYVSKSKSACDSMRKTVQLFHDMLTKGMNQLQDDPNCEAS